MKNSVLSLLSIPLLVGSLQAQVASTSVEIVKVHDGVEIPELAGYVTYRVYVNTEHENDFISTIYGNTAMIEGDLRTQPMGLTLLSGELFTSQYGSYFPSSCSLSEIFPEVKYDSFFTIGSECLSSPGESVMEVSMIPAGFYSAFESGNPINVEEGGYFTVQSFDNGWSGAEKRVMIAQFTTNGDWEFCFSVQGQKLGVPGLDNKFNDLDICVTPGMALFTPEVEVAGGPFFAVYPNPTRDIFFLESSEEAHVMVYDLLGNEVEYRFIPGSGRFEFNLSGQADGMYLLVIRTKDEALTKRVVKH